MWVLDDALAVALVEPEVEAELVVALCALPSEFERLAIRVPSAPERALADTELPLVHDVGLFLVREEEKVMSAHYNQLAMNRTDPRRKTYSEQATTGVSVSYHLQSSVLTICEVEGRQ